MMKVNKGNWEIKKLEDVCSAQTSNIIMREAQTSNGEYPLFGASGFIKNIKTYHQEEPYIGVIKDGSGIGRVNIYPPYSSLLGTMQYIIPKSNVTLDFLRYLLIGMRLERFKSGAAIPHIYFKNYKNEHFLLPPKTVQISITSELNTINSLIVLKQKQLQEFDSLELSVFHKMFGDQRWDTQQLKEIAIIKIGPFGSLLHKNDYIKGGTPLVNPVHMVNGRIIISQDFTVNCQKKEELSSYLLKANDIVFARRGDIGRCALVTNKENNYICGTGSLFVRFIKTIEPLYALFYLSSNKIRHYLIQQAKGAIMLNINAKTIGNIPFSFPPLSLQQSFAQKIEVIEKQKEVVKNEIAQLQALLDSEMDKYFG